MKRVVPWVNSFLPCVYVAKTKLNSVVKANAEVKG